MYFLPGVICILLILDLGKKGNAGEENSEIRTTEMLKSVRNIAPKNLQILHLIVLSAEIITTFKLKATFPYFRAIRNHFY